MRKQFLLSVLFAFAGASLASALDYGDYVYTRSARYVIQGEENLVTNGDFSVADPSSDSFGWTGSDGGEINTDYASVEQGAGPDGENVLLSTSSSSSNVVMQAVPFSAGGSYIVTFKAKCTSEIVTHYLHTNAYLVDIYAIKDPSVDKDDGDNVTQISGVDAIGLDWSDLTFYFEDTSEEDGYIVIYLAQLPSDTYITDVEVREAKQVGDDRVVERALEEANYILSIEDMTSDNVGFAEAIETITGMYLYAPEELDDYSNTTSLISELEDIQEEYLDENSSDLSSSISYLSPSSWGSYSAGGVSSIGYWTLTGAASRWGHSSGSEFCTYMYSNSYTLGWGQATLRVPDQEAGKYLFGMNSLAIKYYSGYSSTGGNDRYIANYNVYTTGAYIFFNSDTLYIDTLANYNYNLETYYIESEIAEGDTIVAGIYFPGFSGGGQFYWGNVTLRCMGISAEEAENIAYVASIAAQQAAVLGKLEEANEYLSGSLPWGKDDLQAVVDEHQALYDASLAYVTVDGELADGVTYSDLPEDYDDELYESYTALKSAISTFESVNEPYTTLVEYVEEAQAIYDDEANADASTSTRTALKTEIDEANALIESVTETEDEDGFTSAYEELKAAVQAFRFSCASFLNPAEVIYTNQSFESGDATGWTATGQTDNGKWRYGEDENFLDGHKIYVSRGRTTYSQNKVSQQVSITEPGVYEFFAQAYAVNTYESYYNSLWNGLTGEDSVRTANVKMYFGLEGDETQVDVLTHQETFGTSVWTYDELRDFTIQYIKTSASTVEETMELGFDALNNGYDEDGNSMGLGANLYGFGSTHIYYYGSEDTYSSGISAASADKVSADDYVYSISGVRVGKASDNLPKGVYISNGKKFIVK